MTVDTNHTPLQFGTRQQLRDLEEAIAAELERRGAATAQRLWRAMMLAPTLEIFHALLAGETVPRARLDQDWLERFGLREDAAA